jgi:hypothetical protein
MTNLMAGPQNRERLAERPAALKNKVKNRADIFYTGGRRKFYGADGWR